jgi:hypothetical protein
LIAVSLLSIKNEKISYNIRKVDISSAALRIRVLKNIKKVLIWLNI